jgi:hypothetical protein
MRPALYRCGGGASIFASSPGVVTEGFLNTLVSFGAALPASKTIRKAPRKSAPAQKRAGGVENRGGYESNA